LDDGVFATDAVYASVRAGVPFRSAYRAVAGAIKRGEAIPRPSVRELLAVRSDLGGAGNPAFAELGREIRTRRSAVSARRRVFERALARLAGGSSA
jgi:argininosuccinate lyase